jgi:hypothetical protein
MTVRTLRKAAAFALLAAVAAMLAPTKARATSVSYFTSGSFTAPVGSTETVTPASTSVTLTSGNSSLTFNFAAAPTTPYSVSTAGTALSFGTFTETSTSTTADNFSGSFTLTIHQTEPNSGTQAFPVSTLTGNVSSVNGSVIVSFGGLSGETVTIPGTATAPPISYTAMTQSIGGSPSTSQPFYGTVTVVPEPASLAMCGTSLLAVTGLALRRRMKAARA